MDRSVGSREPQAPLIEAEAEAEAGVKAQGSTGLRAEG